MRKRVIILAAFCWGFTASSQVSPGTVMDYAVTANNKVSSSAYMSEDSVKATESAGFADSLLNFIATNKKRSSIFITEQDSVLAKVNETLLMPVGSTSNMLIAIEFAKQVGGGFINEMNYIPIADLKQYYIDDLDKEAYPKWLKYETDYGFVRNDSIQLLEVARGMMMYNCNANTEYLLDLLGLDNVNANVSLFGIEKHTSIYPIVSSIFIYQNPKKGNEKSILKDIRKLSEESYCRTIYEIHKELKEDTLLKKKFNIRDLSPKMQKLWSDRLPASTTKDYVQLCKSLNTRKHLSEFSYAILSEVLETYMENPERLRWLKHAGMQEGNSVSILTKALYATTRNDDKISMAYFFNDLTREENEKLQLWKEQFELKIISDQDFRKKIRQTLQ